MKVLAVVEDDPDVAFLVETIFSMDSRFTVAAVADSAEQALTTAPSKEPGTIMLDHGLAGVLTGLEAEPKLNQLVPRSKIILFTTQAELEARAQEEPAIDAFLLKTESTRLLALAQELTGLRALSG